MSEVTQDKRQAQANEPEKEERWTVVFNELCSDGVFRPVWICPRDITNIKRLIPRYPVVEHREAATSIMYNGREVLLFEEFETVISSLGTSLIGCNFYSAGLFYADRMFKKKGLRYLPEVERPDCASPSLPVQTTVSEGRASHQ